MVTTILNHTNRTDRHIQFFDATGHKIAPFTRDPAPHQQAVGKLTICPAVAPKQVAQVRMLMHAFVQWLRIRYQGSPWFIDGYFSRKAFEAELASLPGEYAPPAGRLLLAGCQGEPAGCVALRGLGKETCEMKRMYVSPDFQGRGIGRALVRTLIAEAGKIGYGRMLLDTGRKQTEARNLYRSLGFKEIEPYYEVDRKQRDMLIFMELRL